MRDLNITKGIFSDGHTGWKVEDRITKGTQIGFEIHFSDDGECITHHVYSEDDAILISKAPEMLELLINVLKYPPTRKDRHNANTAILEFLNSL